MGHQLTPPRPLPSTTDFASLVHCTDLALRYLLAAGLSRLAETHGRSCFAVATRKLGPDHPNALTTRRNIARLMMKRGQKTEALAEFQAVLEARIRVLGPDHPDTLATKNWIP